MRGLSTRDLCDDLRESALGRKVRAVVIAGTHDQTAGMARELRADYGIDVNEVLGEALQNAAQLPRVIKQAHLIVTTKRFGKSVSALARRLGKPSIVASIRPSIISDDLLSLMQREVFLIARDPQFLALLREYLTPIPGGNNVTMLVAGRDSLASISSDSPTYVTQAAREILGTTRIPGRLIPPARVFAADCVREILGVIVALNLGVMHDDIA